MVSFTYLFIFFTQPQNSVQFFMNQTDLNTEALKRASRNSSGGFRRFFCDAKGHRVSTAGPESATLHLILNAINDPHRGGLC